MYTTYNTSYFPSMPISASANAYLPDVRDRQAVAYECVSASTLTVTLEGAITPQDTESAASWIQLPCYQLSAGVLTRKNPGDVLTLIATDIVFASVGVQSALRLKRAGGSGVVTGVGTTNDIEALISEFSGGATSITLASNHAEDAAAVSGDTGDTILGVRNDTLATGTSTDGDYSFIATDKRGRVMSGHAPRELKGKQFTTITSSTSETTIVTAVASTFLDLYKLVIANTSASATEVSIRDATGGSVIESFYVPAGDTRGFTIDQDSADPQTTVNNNWTAQCGTSVASIKISAFFTKNI